MKCTNCGTSVRPVVGVDIDGTLGDWHAKFFNFAREWLGLAPEALTHLRAYTGAVDMATHMGLTKRDYRQVKLAFRQSGLKRSMDAWPGAMGLMAGTLRNLDVEIWITTTRPYLQVGNIDEDTREWLRRNMLPFDHLVYGDDKYAELLGMVDPARVVCVLEDQLEDWERARSLGIKALFRRNQWNQGARPETTHSVGSLFQAGAEIATLVTQWKEQHAAA